MCRFRRSGRRTPDSDHGLAVILDAHSHKVLGWELSRSLRTEELTLPALERALASRPVPEGLIHHSDQGMQ